MPKLTTKQWAAAHEEYVVKGMSQRELAEMYNISEKNLCAYATRHGWEADRKAYKAKRSERYEKMASKQASKCVGTADKVYAACDILAARILDELASDDLKRSEYKTLASTLRDVKEICAFRSKLDDAEQEARIAKLNAEVERVTSGGDSEVNIIINGADGLSV